MHYALHVSLVFSIALCSALYPGKAAKSAINPDILTTFAKNVASILSPTLLGDLQNSRTNRSLLGLSSITRKNAEDELKSSPGSRDSKTDAATPEIYQEQTSPYRFNRFSNTRRQADELYNPYERPNYPENPAYRHSQFYDPYNVQNNYFQPDGPDSRNALRENPNLNRPINTANLANTENAEPPGRFGQLYRPNERTLNEDVLGRRFNGFNGFAGYSSFDARRRGDIRYHHSPLPIDGHYFGPFGFDPHGPYHHPFGYKHPYVYNDRRPKTDSNNSGENNTSKEETKEENESDRPKSDNRPYYGGYKPFYGFPGYPIPPYKFGPGYYHRGGHNDSFVGHRHYDDPYYHKHYDFPYYDDFYYPGPFHPYGYGPRPKNGNKNGGGNDNGATPETQENKDAETISASEKKEETVGASSSEYETRIPAIPFVEGLENERILDQEILDSVEGVDLNNNK